MRGKGKKKAKETARAPVAPPAPWISEAATTTSAGELAALEVLEASMMAALEDICARRNESLCMTFGVVEAVASVWRLLGAMPPLLVRDEASVASAVEPEPMEPGIDAWASLFLHCQGRRDVVDLRLPEKQRLWPPLACNIECADPRLWTAPTPQRRRELFRLIDNRHRGRITTKQLHAWLAMQGNVSLSEVKKLVAGRGTEDIDEEVFAGVLADLEASDPGCWGAQEKLCVFALPRPRVDPRALVDEQELKELLMARKGPLSATTAPSEFQTRDRDEIWAGKATEVVTGAALQRALSTGRDDRLQGIAAQVKITSPHRRPMARPPSSAKSTVDFDKKTTGSRASSASSKRLSHSRSSPAVRFQHLIDENPPEDDVLFWPCASGQTSLVENHEFVPEAGVTATDRVGSRQDKLVRGGPTWPTDPRHMSRTAYEEMRRELRPATAPALEQPLVEREEDLATATPPHRRRTVCRRREDEGTVIVATPSSWHDNSFFLDGPAFAGARPLTASETSQAYDTALERLDRLEAEAIREIRGEGHGGVRLGTLPTPDPLTRLRNRALVSCRSDARIVRERSAPAGKAFRAVRQSRVWSR